MAITTTLARHFAIRLIAIGVVSMLLSVWGAYDLWVKIPAEEASAARFEALTDEKDSLEQLSQTGMLTDQGRDRYDQVEAELNELTADGTPTPPSKFDRLMQWAFISCILMVPYCLWQLVMTGRRVYRMEEDGTLIMPEGTWAESDVADIDMSRWMAKSVAWVVHKDGRRVKLDDHLHRNLHLIIGRIASRLYPDQWEQDARRIRSTGADEPASEAAGVS